MAYTKQYSKTTWVNNEAPAINATNLNKIEEGIDNVDTELVSQDSRISNLEANEVDATGIDAGYVPTADGQDGWSWQEQGTPTVVTLASEMTNTDKLYLYEGSESGYSAGYLYYYDRTNEIWVRGSHYGSVEPNVTYSNGTVRLQWS